MIEPNDNLRRLLLALNSLTQNKRAVAALQALVAADTLLTLFLFGQDYFRWWRSPLAPAVDAALVGLMTALSLTLCWFLALVASLYFAWRGRSPARAQPSSRTLRMGLHPVLYALPALWGHAYLEGGDPTPWGSLAVAYAVAYNVCLTGILTAERLAELWSGGSGVAKTQDAAAKRRARPSARNALWRRWWSLTHVGHLRRMRPLDRALYVAVARGDARGVGAYLTRGADPNVRIVFDAPLLGFAVSRGHAEVVRLMLEAGADANVTSPSTGVTPLISAAMRGDLAVTRLLLERGATVNDRSRNGTGALSMAARSGDAEVVRLLLARGAWANGQSNSGATALMVAASAGHAGVVRAMLEAGADASLADAKGITALEYARRKGHAAVIALLAAGRT